MGAGAPVSSTREYGCARQFSTLLRGLAMPGGVAHAGVGWRIHGNVQQESSYSAAAQLDVLCQHGAGLLGSPKFEVGQSSNVH